MTLLITVFAAIICTLIWYFRFSDRKYGFGTLCLMYWGASLMWSVDAVAEYLELHDEYFQPAAADMLNDAFLGFCVVALGLIIWLVIMLIRDPKGIVRNAIKTK